jgi:membrane-bound lytic murein transglycosylase MltF
VIAQGKWQELRGKGRLTSRVAAHLGAVLLLAGCDQLPRDSAGALKRIQTGGEMRVGVAEHEPWVRWEGDRATGLEAELIEQWAQTLGVRVIWRKDALTELVQALHRRELDVIAAGLEETTPHASEVALSQPYLEVPDRRGKKTPRALAVIPGENALLLSLDRFLTQQDEAKLRQRLAELSQPAP